jgi:hypothetical protein
MQDRPFVLLFRELCAQGRQVIEQVQRLSNRDFVIDDKDNWSAVRNALQKLILTEYMRRTHNVPPCATLEDLSLEGATVSICLLVSLKRERRCETACAARLAQLIVRRAVSRAPSTFGGSPRSVFAILLPDHLVHVVHGKTLGRNMDVRSNRDLRPAGLARLPLGHPLGIIE